jgi:hypothetical protein
MGSHIADRHKKWTLKKSKSGMPHLFGPLAQQINIRIIFDIKYATAFLGFQVILAGNANQGFAELIRLMLVRQHSWRAPEKGDEIGEIGIVHDLLGMGGDNQLGFPIPGEVF